MTVDTANHQIQSNGSQPLDKIFSENVLAKVLRVAVEALKNNDPPTEYPEFVPQKGASTGSYILRESSFWTCGFFPGLLYLLLERAIRYPSTFPYLGHNHNLDPASLRDHLLTLCTKWTTPIYPMSLRTDTHDLGFILAPSLRRSWELTSNTASLQALLTGAQSLASRFVPSTGAIRSWDALRQSDVEITSLETDCLVIIDSMMNLDLLFYAAAHLGPELAAIATTHAKTLINSHLRRESIAGKEAYSTIHVVNFDPATGAIKERRTAQGYSATSTWARGQAWAITGYAQTYAWTKDRQFLHVAVGLAEYFLARLDEAPACVEKMVDGRMVGRYVPLWDFDAPVDKANPLRDSSAGVIAANGMLLLSQVFVGDDEGLARRFRDAAMRIVSETVEFSYSREEARLVKGGKQVEDVSGERFDAILRNATANHNAKDLDRYSDHGLVYADYYLLEFGNQLLKLGLI
ncbi:hypothetical protein Asppvi_010365 [Aspergillus pseudoviridinutans]|uniref:Glucuronyl hydrolase n=1 Tax=Aspergillus pseudoviridinutans TaxID=1517512 RepID=A0A9P3BHK5_9EURO|nr:uncharacterized protein Asppvi_010365 [Aspergillus pseudoviridinutans]GIJ91400.1 hypothetical protein Asppvi_010365 [Aspergillus pseudoviridinutans]